ncbi:SPOR domain-containing protein [Draconibacterium halophilum]|uniref:SPOR domain-containing protein n=1 Tax=Draconibacterium halophilum TaxID=2706887 RepID=A0A6C0RGY5_9BACT|nr:SPOR domain-containing protein [Draconibacterium halophilum]QIA09784.1 hypothetical protein G0Q07_19665 [Draconibacterium halophilum]
MLQQCFLIIVLLSSLNFGVCAQSARNVNVRFVKNEVAVLPGKVVNLAFVTQNQSSDSIEVTHEFSIPDRWVVITRPGKLSLQPNEKKLSIVSIRAPFDCPVGSYPIQINKMKADVGINLSSQIVQVKILEIENITFQLIEQQNHILAGENISATYLIRNLGNTDKKLYINASNCDLVGSPDVKLDPGESTQIQITKPTSEELFESKTESFTVRAQVGERILESVYASTMVLPSRKAKKDLFFRFPVKASVSYLSTNRGGNYESAKQFQIDGNGTLDPEGKHRLGFMARWPNNTNLSFLGLYDQYYLSYSNKNIDLFLGEKSYTVTPLTEASRFGRGVEAKFLLKNGFGAGFFYVKPRFYEDIENEFSVFAGFDFNSKNNISFYYLGKKYQESNDPVQLFSFVTELNPFKRTKVDLELSRGMVDDETSNAIRSSINSQFSIFQISGIYFNVGKNYPGYYSNSKFFSTNINARISQKMSVSFNAREDFGNAQLDTFFVTAPYSKSIQGSLNYRISQGGNVKIYWREFESKDRLIKDKFHYKTDSWNLEYGHRYKRIDYTLRGEIGETTNLLAETNKNIQNSFRASANLTYRFNSRNSVRLFGNWSNINQFVSGDQRRLMAGLAATSRISKNLRLNCYIQNAYDINDYYRNRNLMQLNLDYKFLKKHTFSLRSFYTIFKNEVDNPEFTLSATYSYSLGIPIKQIVKAGKIRGRITNQLGEPVSDVFIRISSETAVTDRNGEYEFKLLSPGRQLLTIDRARLDIGEIPNIPMPLEVEIIENEETEINIQIQKGARLSGQIKLGESALSVLNDQSAQPDNILIELKSNLETYRITTNKEGEFTFPLVRPGEVLFRIYTNTIPAGYSAAQSTYTFHLNPGEQREVDIVLESKKKKIIFKSQNTTLSANEGFAPMKVTTVLKPQKKTSQLYYSVQIGAFSRSLAENSKFLRGQSSYFEKQIDNLHKYFIGKFDTVEEAQKERKRLSSFYTNPFIVVFKDEKIIPYNEFKSDK